MSMEHRMRNAILAALEILDGERYREIDDNPHNFEEEMDAATDAAVAIFREA